MIDGKDDHAYQKMLNTPKYLFLIKVLFRHYLFHVFHNPAAIIFMGSAKVRNWWEESFSVGVLRSNKQLRFKFRVMENVQSNESVCKVCWLRHGRCGNRKPLVLLAISRRNAIRITERAYIFQQFGDLFTNRTNNGVIYSPKSTNSLNIY